MVRHGSRQERLPRPGRSVQENSLGLDGRDDGSNNNRDGTGWLGRRGQDQQQWGVKISVFCFVFFVLAVKSEKFHCSPYDPCPLAWPLASAPAVLLVLCSSGSMGAANPTMLNRVIFFPNSESEKAKSTRHLAVKDVATGMVMVVPLLSKMAAQS